MTRFHVHVAVEDLAQSVRFYSTLFGVEPTVHKPDYAKWMLEDPRVNFAISQRGGKPGVQHLGIQAEDEDELTDIFGRLERAERPVLEEKGTTCCYAQSDKQWVSDPQNVAWETFLTHGESTVYGRSGAVSRLEEVTAEACCGPNPAALAAAPKPAAKCGCG
ncbi:MAG TPA: ArsI/CadI family heavy metal resistance metalloenzyme [Alphaproteobacteria bacterium]|nr:ArsI/CadI family heavy metal resistance metalloenzyme [Alphaproteobacteria bacterium]